MILLYRYFRTHGLESLEEERLKLSRVSAFNDPFECMYRTAGTMTPAKAKSYLLSKLKSNNPFWLALHRNPQRLARAIEAVVRDFDEIKQRGFAKREAALERSLRVICFAKSEVGPLDEILMWSHYAGSHQGIRIGFSFPRGIKFPFVVKPVRYRKDRISVDISGGVSASLKAALLKSITTKSQAWSYEQEYRLIASPRYCDHAMTPSGEKHSFVRLNPDWVRRVDFGARFPDEQIGKARNFLRQKYPTVPCFRAIYHKTDYALEYQTIE